MNGSCVASTDPSSKVMRKARYIQKYFKAVIYLPWPEAPVLSKCQQKIMLTERQSYLFKNSFRSLQLNQEKTLKTHCCFSSVCSASAFSSGFSSLLLHAYLFFCFLAKANVPPPPITPLVSCSSIFPFRWSASFWAFWWVFFFTLDISIAQQVPNHLKRSVYYCCSGWASNIKNCEFNKACTSEGLSFEWGLRLLFSLRLFVSNWGFTHNFTVLMCFLFSFQTKETYSPSW